MTNTDPTFPLENELNLIVNVCVCVCKCVCMS